MRSCFQPQNTRAILVTWQEATATPAELFLPHVLLLSMISGLCDLGDKGEEAQVCLAPLGYFSFFGDSDRWVWLD